MCGILLTAADLCCFLGAVELEGRADGCKLNRAMFCRISLANLQAKSQGFPWGDAVFSGLFCNEANANLKPCDKGNS